MPSGSEFSILPDENVTIGGKSIAENQTATGDVNNIIRYLAATIRDTYNRTSTGVAFMPISGGTFSGDIMRQNRGGYLHHANSAQNGGQVYFLPEGSVRPAAVEGTVVFYYS